MTSPRLPLEKVQRSFLLGIRLNRELYGLVSESNSATYKKTEVRNSQGFSFEVMEIPLKFKQH